MNSRPVVSGDRGRGIEDVILNLTGTVLTKVTIPVAIAVTECSGHSVKSDCSEQGTLPDVPTQLHVVEQSPDPIIFSVVKA